MRRHTAHLPEPLSPRDLVRGGCLERQRPALDADRYWAAVQLADESAPRYQARRPPARQRQASGRQACGNWFTRGCPYREKPRSKVGSPYAFDLEEVKQWRLEQERDGRPQGGLKLERLPRGSEDRPDHENGMLFLTEAAVRSELWRWVTAEDGANMVQGMLLDASDGDARKANQALRIVVLSVVYAFTGWLTGDDFNRELLAGGRGINEVWSDCIGRRVRTAPPTDRDAIRLEFPDWLLGEAISGSQPATNPTNGSTLQHEAQP